MTESCIRLRPNNPSVHFVRGLAYEGKGDTDRATASYAEAVRLKPDYVEVYFQRGMVYAKKGNNPAAIADFTQVVKLNPTHAEAYYQRGLAYVAQGDKDKALADWRKVLDISKDANLRQTVTQLLNPAPTRPRSPCGELPPGMAGLLWINHFPEFATVTLTDHQYRVEGNSQLLMLIPGGKKFVIDANIVGVGQLKAGPFTWEAGECHIVDPNN